MFLEAQPRTKTGTRRPTRLPSAMNAGVPGENRCLARLNNARKTLRSGAIPAPAGEILLKTKYSWLRFCNFFLWAKERRAVSADMSYYDIRRRADGRFATGADY